MQALDEARRRAEQELNRATQSAGERHRRISQVGSHVLTLREGELESRLKDRERDIEGLRVAVCGTFASRRAKMRRPATGKRNESPSSKANRWRRPNGQQHPKPDASGNVAQWTPRKYPRVGTRSCLRPPNAASPPLEERPRRDRK